ncbi:hypothetical protein HGP14_14765 [Rhizobium sp. P32RR-XVIII]|uniref:D-alanyl-D-alanine carboxypeptidase family protein n=1 Tax=Rhizobium sp. P32RR-XVIII TaxID=2726738 RepID=UPI001456447F|nr:D-alanyl-D-alanine carboxypeptidase family protein [Rhizobium sp. P32RR-XVIII]NLS04618.1 hypothetical protein [Rhizobium sp. P32RR-XVIII]
MPTDEERLVIALEARVKDFERNFNRASKTANDNFNSIEKRAKQSADTLEKSFGDLSGSFAGKIKGLIKPFMAGGILAAGVTAAATALGEVAKSVAEVDREARKAGVSAKVWQQWAYVATATGMNIDGVTDALKELNIRGDEFAKTGKGSAQEAFTRLGYTASDVAKRIKDPSAFLDEIIGKLQQMDAAAQTRILDETFGGQGAEELAKVLGLSVDQIKKLRSEAATFSDEQIESAKKIDQEFNTLWRNVTVYAKKAAIESASYAGKIIDVLSTLKGDKLIAGYKSNALSPEAQLRKLEDRRDGILKEIEHVQSDPFNALKEAELRQLQASLAAVEQQIEDLGGGSDELKSALAELSAITQTAGNTFDHSATSAANFKTALNEIKTLVPGLKADLDSLATMNGIDAAYQRAVSNARTMGDVRNATDLANRAKAAVRVNNATTNTSAYLDGFLSNGKSNASVEGMASAFAKKLATMFASMPDELRGQISITSGFRDIQRQQQLWAEALEKYGSPEAARKWVAPPGKSQHNSGNAADLGFASDAVRQWVHANASSFGLQFPLNNENWHIEDADARRSADSAAVQQQINLAKQHADARKSLNQTIQEGLDLARFEQSISTMSAQQQAIELGVYRAKAEAKRAGITLSEQEIQQIREQVTATQQLQAANDRTAKATEGMQEAQQFFAEGFTNALSGLITGTTTLESAMQQLANSIINAALQAILLGQGPLAGLGGGKSSSGGRGAIGGLLGWLFSAKGGPVSHSRRSMLYLAGGGDVRGPGTSTSDSIPAMLSDGEFVVNAAATKRHRAALEAINSGRAPAFLAKGGIAGSQLAGRSGGVSIGNINMPIKIETQGSSGDPVKDQEHQRNLSKQVGAAVDQHMTEWFLNQSRPGGLLTGRR